MEGAERRGKGDEGESRDGSLRTRKGGGARERGEARRGGGGGGGGGGDEGERKGKVRGTVTDHLHVYVCIVSSFMYFRSLSCPVCGRRGTSWQRPTAACGGRWRTWSRRYRGGTMMSLRHHHCIMVVLV